MAPLTASASATTSSDSRWQRGAAWKLAGGNVAETDKEIRDILERCQTVAVVGIKTLETEDAYRVPHYMQSHGYRIVPVNPKLDNVLGHPAHATLPEVDEPIDLVNLFRASDHISGHVDEILAMSPRPAAVWMQLGIHNGAQAARLRAAGVHVVQDRCIMVEHKRLVAANSASN
jgi:predicted CoA-binding protein